MKLVRVGVALLMLVLPAACSSQQKLGYDIGSCSPTDYSALHFDVVGKDLSLTWTNDDPGVVTKTTPALYKFQKEDKAGKHYLSPNGHVELILKTDKDMIFGLTKVDGKVEAILFGVEGDGSKLAANGNGLFNVCKRLRAESGWDDPAGPSTQN